MTNPSPLPHTVDGVRLDTLAYNIESLTGTRGLPRTRSGDVVVPGLHGVVASLYDDYEPGELALRMWVRDTDVNGKPVLTDTHRKQQLDRNLDRLFALFRSSPRLLDVRMATGPDLESQYQVLANQRCDKSGSQTTVVRTNTITNPSFERATGTVATRSNLCQNPNFETNATSWSGVNGTLTRSTTWKASGAASGQLSTSGSGTSSMVYTRTFAPVAGDVYTSSAMVASTRTIATLTMRLSIKWYDASSVLLQTDTGPEVSVAANGKVTNGVPVFRQAITSGVCPTGTAKVELVAEVVQTARPAGELYYVDNVLLEQASTLGEYFDGNSGTGYSWNGTANASTSVFTEPTPNDWGVNTPECQLVQHTKFVGPLYGSSVAELRTVHPLDALVSVMWQGGTVPAASASPSGQWSAAISIRSDMDPAPRFRLRIRGLDSGGDPVGWARVGSPTGPESAGSLMTASSFWWRYRLEGVYLPTGSVSARLEITTHDDLGDGALVYFDTATLEPNPSTPFYFDGDYGDGYSWSGTKDASTSVFRAATVSSWGAVNGTFTVAALASTLPVDGAHAHGVLTATTSDNANQSRVTTNMYSPDTPERYWTGGAWLWGHDGVNYARTRVDYFDASSTVLASSASDYVAVTGGWTWVAVGPMDAPAGTVKVRLRLTAYAATDGSAAPVNATMWVSGAMLATADGEVAQTRTPVAADYFDELSPGARKLSNTSTVQRFPQVRQAMCKTADAVVPQVEGTGTYVARLSVLLEIPGVFWQDPDTLVWDTQVVGGSTGTFTREITNLRGATAPIEDAVIIVYGPATNPKVTDPRTGAWVRLNMTVPSGQAWMVDAGRDISAVGGQSLDPNSAKWVNRRQFTDWTSPRSRLFVLHPEFDDTRGDHVVRVTVQGSNRARVIARRKWL